VIRTRIGLGALGVVVGLYGAYLFLSRQQESRQLWSAAKYLVGGVVLNDAILAAVLLAIGYVVVRVLPQVVRAPVVVGGVVLGSTTLLAIPVLLSYGRKPDNPTLLDRDFVAGWWVFASVVLVSVAVAIVVRLRQRPRVQTGRGGKEHD
jgi:drug/metabolite transporter (DMT)-like permease